jgi:hypothetical protein
MRKDILDVIKTFPFNEVSLGYRMVTLCPPEEFEQAQIGYSVDPNGQSLVGTGQGDWYSSWLVIGYEDGTGDPIFVDTIDEQFPVYTAIHGEGDWEPDKIAVSLDNFISALSHIKELSAGRENPVSLEENPISLKEREQVLKLISKANECVSMGFWKSWLEDE